jgi:hypothetical protein
VLRNQSHYAEKHKGVCLGFDLPRADVTEMKYNDQRLLNSLDKAAADPTKLPHDLQQLLLCTEAQGWEYELEVRRFVKLRDNQITVCTRSAAITMPRSRPTCRPERAKPPRRARS